MALKRDKVLKVAEKLVAKGKLDQAVREYEKILKRFPNDTTTINRVGDLYGRMGQLQRSIELYEEVADHFVADGFTNKAIAILKKIQRLDPQRLDIFERLADLYFDMKLLVEAKREYEILADWYVKNGELEKAIEAHEKLVNLDPSNHVSALRLAELLLRRGETTSALKVYDKLGSVLIDAGKLDAAERLYRKILEQSPPDGEFLVPVCEVFFEAGRTAVVLEFLNYGIERSPDSVGLKSLMVRIHLGMGKSEEALQLAREILEVEPDNAEVRSLVGGALMASGSTEEARDILLPSIKQLLDKSDHRGAQKALKGMLEEFPEDQQVLKLAVQAWGPSGDEETLYTLRAALAETLFESGELEAAKRLFLDLLEAKPDNERFRKRLTALDGVNAEIFKVVDEEVPSEVETVEEIVVDEAEIEEIPFQPPVEPPAKTVSESVATVVPEDVPTPVPTASTTAPPAPATFDLEERLAEATVFAKYGLVEKAISHLEDVVLFCPNEIEPRRRLALLYAENGDRNAAVAMAKPVVEQYRLDGTMTELAPLFEAIPELRGAGSTGGAEPSAIEPPPAAVVPPPLSEPAGEEPEVVAFVDEESDLIEVVDIEGDLALNPPEEPELAVEEFSVDHGPGIAIVDEGSAEEPAETISFEVPPAPPVAQVPPPVSQQVKPPVEPISEEEVADELVEITDSFVGPSMGDLEQLDFFLDQELYDDATRVLATLEEEHPDDPEVKSRRLKLKDVGVLLEQVETVEEGAEELFADEEQYIDLAKELEAELAAEEAMVDEATGRGKGEAALEEVFREFQKGVAEQLSEEDSDTHFNLGIAYREMGLLPEAIREFQVSSRDKALFVESCSIIGVCYQEQGMWSEAADWYQKALVAPDITDDARLGLRYDLASAYQGSGDIGQALEIFEEIAASNAGYRNINEKLANLSQHRQAN